MKMNKKGFTLIELLAVIVILAIIALIAVPQVIKILNSARQSAAEDSAYGIIKAAESYVATYMMENQGDWISGDETIIFDCSNGKCESTETVNGSKVTLDFKGTKPKQGIVTLDSDGEAKITTALVINGFSCKQDGDSVDCSTKASA